MKLLTLIILFMGAVVCWAGCKDDTHRPASEAVSEKLVLKVMELDHDAMELSIQVCWLGGRLEKCLSELEKKAGIEPIPFDWVEVSGFPKIKQDPNKPSWYTSKLQPFYAPCPTVKKPEINIERYTNLEYLNAYIEIQLSARKAYMLGIDEYIKHLEERLKRLKGHLEK